MILDEIVNYTKGRVQALKEAKPMEEIIKAALGTEKKHSFAFAKALAGEGMAFICEVKKASPSKGIISERFPYLEIAQAYEQAGANAISVLTEPHFFLGSDQYLKDIKAQVNIPVLRKDFIIDPYQIYEAKVIGADAVLLICSLLDLKTLKDYLQLVESLGLSALVETHTEEEIDRALEAGAAIIGINNRNLKTFEVDLQTTISLRRHVPKDKILVSESGIKTAEDMERLRHSQVDAVLIGEAFMRQEDKAALMRNLQSSEEEA
ncbi:Indole-3-glycerol phosphate synthase [Desulfosporosinus orientis DSM 765]|uniref:Indole-3-glycerol phosphate synthase n=1 Tax=Desulfosporosinus orientis (strain ATCC 19365 / DSM 765 / NCIMB 8382 / VKM B-1628 / Singapore I) TaxID=768706 RepID=G7WAR1_DESOD|nr:indole-3-glycerol phosphate synthase TrpC [Desulfosporosinus orientis]AET67122.1 Indole-3-glycerol phosphate synthase [Desulfosporosinus orientis DSM 765]